MTQTRNDERLILDGLALPVLELDRASRILYCNAAVVAVTGIARDAVVGQVASDVFSEWQELTIAATVQACLQTGAPQSIQGWWRAHYYRVEISATPQGVLLVGYDLTEYARAEQRLRESEANISAIMNTIPESLALIARDGTLITINTAAARRLNTTPNSAVGTCVYDYLAPAIAAVRKARIDEVFATGTPAHFEDRRGNRMYVNSVYPVPVEQGLPTRVVVFALDVTQLRQRERELQFSHARYRAIVDDQTELICRFTPDCRLTFVNQAYCNFFGKSFFQLLGNSIFDQIPASDHAHVRAQMAAFRPHASVNTYENIVANLRGAPRWLQWTARALFDPQGAVVELQAVGRDVTERKQVEEQLRRANERFNQMAEQSRTIIWEVDATGLFTYLSPVTERVFGYRPEELVGKKHFYDLHPEEDRAAYQRAAFEVFAQKQPFSNFENTVMAASGHVIWVSTNGLPILDEHGTLLGYRGADTDITVRKSAVLAVIESEQRYRALYQNLPLATATWKIVGDDFVLLNINQTAMIEASTTAEHLVGQRASLLYGDQSDVLALLRETAQCRGRQQRDLAYTALLSHHAHPVTCTCGFVPPDLVLMHIEDITVRRRAESRLRHYQRQLRALASQLTLAEERERRSIAADLHDQVCQTLAAVKLKLGMLAQTVAKQATATELKTIATMINQCLHATRDLSFDLSPPVLYELGLEAALEWLAEHLRHPGKTALRVVSTGPPAPLPDDLRVLLFIVTRELIMNAIKHAHAHEIVVKVETVDHVRIVVRDDGRGFAPELTPTALRQRRGFGLFSIRERLRPFGGTIQIDTAPGAGTSVTIALPPEPTDR